MGGRHEHGKQVLIPLAPMYAAGAVSLDDTVVSLRAGKKWVRVEADWKYVPLVPVLDSMFTPRWLWALRRPEGTVASMVGKGWYLPDDDGAWPVGMLRLLPSSEREEGMMWQAWTPQPAFRVTAPLVGEASLPEWGGWPQHVRCAWWWDWACRRLWQTLPASRSLIVRGEERTDLRQVAEWAGVGMRGASWENASTHPELPAGQTADVRAVCHATLSLLYP